MGLFAPRFRTTCLVQIIQKLNKLNLIFSRLINLNVFKEEYLGTTETDPQGRADDTITICSSFIHILVDENILNEILVTLPKPLVYLSQLIPTFTKISFQRHIETLIIAHH